MKEKVQEKICLFHDISVSAIFIIISMFGFVFLTHFFFWYLSSSSFKPFVHPHRHQQAHHKNDTRIIPLANLIMNILDFNSYSGVPNGESNHENSGDGAPRGESRGRPRRYQNRGPRRSRTSESGGNGKPAPGEKVNNFDN